MTDETKLTEQECRRKAAIDLFNLTWELSDKPDRTEEETDQMIHAAHASRFHWGEVGTTVNHLRGDWQIAHVYTILDLPERALHYARLCLQQCEATHISDFDLAYAYAGMSRALACNGDLVEAEKFYRLAADAGKMIHAEEDYQQFESDLTAPPWYGLR